MTHHPISLHEIDFSQPDGEFILKGQIYQLKEYLGKYFFRNKFYKASNFIYSSFRDYLYLEKEFCQKTQTSSIKQTELKPLFEQYSGLKVIYESNYEDNPGGFVTIKAGDWYDKEIFSRQAQQLFELIFDYNFFTGTDLQFECKFSGSGFDYYTHHPYSITVEVQAPSQHERLEASLELQSWLKGKLPEEEVKSYFEGTYVLDLPNPLKRQQLIIDNIALKPQQINIYDIPF